MHQVLFNGEVKMIKPFMTNACYHPYCKSVNCEKCFFYNPKFLGVRVPRFIGNLLFKLEEKICK